MTAIFNLIRYSSPAPEKTIVKTTYDDIDDLNRQFVWTLFSDGSALTQEITRHCGDAARRTKETYRAEHPVGSWQADYIAKF